MKTAKTTLGLLAIVGLAATSQLGFAQIDNGEFDAPLDSGWVKDGYWPDPTHRLTEPNGNNYCWMTPQPDDSKPETKLSQNFPCGNDTTKSCQVTFWFRFAPNGVGAIKGKLEATLTGSNAANSSTETFEGAVADGKWRLGMVKAKVCERKTISFKIPRGANMKVHLDKVKDVCVPEPGTYVAMSLGLVLVLARRQK